MGSSPCDLAAEQAVLGAFLIDEETWPRIGDTFSPEPFSLQAHRAIAVAILGRCTRGEPPDPILLRGDLVDAGDEAAAELVLRLARSLGTSGNVAYYWQRLLALHLARAADRPDAFAALSIADALAREQAALEGGPKHVATGWLRLDRALGGGFAIPSLNILGAAPKSGKSTWAQIVAERHVEAGGFVYYVDLENGRRRFVRRLLCRRARLGATQLGGLLHGHPAPPDSQAQERWEGAKRWLQRAGPAWLVEFTPPADLAGRVASARARAGDRSLLVVIDSLQKLPMELDDRRAGVDGWVRLLERLRHEHDAAVLLISEIKRDQRGQYTAHEAAFKESGGIEYSADLALTLTRPTADEACEASSTLRVELARECDTDPRGVVAAYRPVFPFHGLEEVDVPTPLRRSRNGTTSGQVIPPLPGARSRFDADA